jgi:hypothetical protein
MHAPFNRTHCLLIYIELSIILYAPPSICPVVTQMPPPTAAALLVLLPPLPPLEAARPHGPRLSLPSLPAFPIPFPPSHVIYMVCLSLGVAGGQHWCGGV